MVFCYKIITETPRRGLSPRKRSSLNVCNLSEPYPNNILSLYDEDSNDTNILDCIPEREWRLLAALARKREEDDEREKLAQQFQKLWQKEKKERELVEAETLDQYQRYIEQKRREEKSWYEYKQYQKTLESQLKRKELINCIKHKEQRSADLLAYMDDKKASIIIDKALEEEARAQLAADRRTRIGEAEEYRRYIDLIDTLKKSDKASKKRDALLKEASQRLAISNALNMWESSLVRQEVCALEAARRAHHAAHAALTDAKSQRLQRIRDAKRRKARKAAMITEQMRDIIRYGRTFPRSR